MHRADDRAMSNVMHEPYTRPNCATMTVPEAAAVLGISESATYDAAARGELPAVKIGRRVLIVRDRLMDMLHDSPTTA
jgi:excisionase family DNA binding protein